MQSERGFRGKCQRDRGYFLCIKDRLPGDLAQTSNFCGSRIKTGTPAGTGPSQQPPSEQAQVSNLQGTRRGASDLGRSRPKASNL